MSKQGQLSRIVQNKVYFGFFAVLFAFVFFCIWGLISYSSAPKASAPPKESLSYETICLNLDGIECAVIMDIADSDQKRIRGLSGRNSMDENRGMLFTSDSAEEQCFWMRGMLIPLDIIWLDESKKILKIDQNISPDTYPTQFCSQQPAKYVIELNANQTSALGLKVGQTLAF